MLINLTVNKDIEKAFEPYYYLFNEKTGTEFVNIKISKVDKDSKMFFKTPVAKKNKPAESKEAQGFKLDTKDHRVVIFEAFLPQYNLKEWVVCIYERVIEDDKRVVKHQMTGKIIIKTSVEEAFKFAKYWLTTAPPVVASERQGSLL